MVVGCSNIKVVRSFDEERSLEGPDGESLRKAEIVNASAYWRGGFPRR
jgi:hypothetical protein